jgi:hypothetical protein
VIGKIKWNWLKKMSGKNGSLSSLLPQCCALPLPERKEFEVAKNTSHKGRERMFV